MFCWYLYILSWLTKVMIVRFSRTFYLPAANQVAHVNCGNCQMWLMYQYGARSVKCAVCSFVTSIGVSVLGQLCIIYYYHQRIFGLADWFAVMDRTWRCQSECLCTVTTSMQCFYDIYFASLYEMPEMWIANIMPEEGFATSPDWIIIAYDWR